MGGGAEDDELDVLALEPGASEGAHRGHMGHIAERGMCDSPLADAGATRDPFV